jgi:MFS family permease
MTEVDGARTTAGTDRARLERQAEELRAKLPRYPLTYLYLLMAVTAIEQADRTILATVFDDVKRTFHVGDGKLGVLVAAFSVVGTIATLPMGFVVDRWNRVWLIALGLVPWAFAMFWTGAATSFGMMFAARLMLGTVQATHGPATPSLIGDYWAVERRSRLYGIFNVGNIAGTLLGFIVAGVLTMFFSWRVSFVVWGAVGLAMAGVLLRVLREPDRGVPDALDHVERSIRRLDDPTPAVPAAVVGTFDYRSLTVREAIVQVMRIRTMWVLFLAASLTEFLLSGLGTWAVSFFRRYHDLSAAGAGGVTALLAVGTVLGVLIGSRAGDRMLQRDRPRQRVVMSAVASCLTLPTIVPAFAATSLLVAVPFFLATGFLIGVPLAVLDAVGLDIVVPQLRGRASSIRSVLRVGMTAAAPAVFGFLSESYGLRSAILYGSPVMLVGGLLMLLAASSYPGDMAFAQAEAHRQHLLEAVTD